MASSWGVFKLRSQTLEPAISDHRPWMARAIVPPPSWSGVCSGSIARQLANLSGLSMLLRPFPQSHLLFGKTCVCRQFLDLSLSCHGITESLVMHCEGTGMDIYVRTAVRAACNIPPLRACRVVKHWSSVSHWQSWCTAPRSQWQIFWTGLYHRRF